MDVFDVARTVLAVRRFQAKTVSDDLVHRIVESARLTGSSSNRQPWNFIVIQDRSTLQQLGALAQSGAYIADAAFAIAVVMERVAPAGTDAGRAVQTMVMTAWAKGIGSNWVGTRGSEEFKTLLGVPADLDIAAIVPFGYPAIRIGKGKKNRKALAQVAHKERFGQPFP